MKKHELTHSISVCQSMLSSKLERAFASALNPCALPPSARADVRDTRLEIVIF